MNEFIPVPAGNLPVEIVVEPFPGGGLLYRLPRRRFPELRWAVIGFGLAAVAVAVPLAGVVQHVRQRPTFRWPDVLVAAPLLASAAAFAAIPIWLWGSHSEIELADGMLRSTERWGLLRWRDSRPLAEIRQLIVGGEALYDDEREPAPPATFTAIRVECHRRRPILITPFYPRSWLLPLSVELARRATAMKREVSTIGEFERPITAFELTARS